jgi:hypothetical protein
MVASRVPWVVLSIGFLMLLINSALLFPVDAVPTGVLDQLHAAAKGACSGQTACPGACVPPGGCQPNWAGACVAGTAGTAGCTLQFSTIGQCSGILSSNCNVTTPCGADVNPSCPPFVNGGCPPGVCTTATVGSSGC